MTGSLIVLRALLTIVRHEEIVAPDGGITLLMQSGERPERYVDALRFDTHQLASAFGPELGLLQ